MLFMLIPLFARAPRFGGKVKVVPVLGGGAMPIELIAFIGGGAMLNAE